THHSVRPKIDSEFRDLLGYFRRHASHRAKNQSVANAKIPLATFESSKNGRNDFLRMQSFHLMKNRRKTRLDINNAIIFHVLQRFVRNALERYFGLHDTACVLNAPQIERQTAAVRVGLNLVRELA